MDDWSARRDVGLGRELDLAERLLDDWVREAPDRRDRAALELV